MAFLLTGFAGMNNTKRGTALNLIYTRAFLHFLHGMSTLISNLVHLLGPKSGSVFLASFLLAGYSCSLEFSLHADDPIQIMHRL